MINLWCCDRKARAACAQIFTLWQQTTIEIMRHNHSIVACSRHLHISVILRANPVRGESQIQRNANGEVATMGQVAEIETFSNIESPCRLLRARPVTF